jgi:uncharacterized secreted repeat protein (TIGR03808 family)
MSMQLERRWLLGAGLGIGGLGLGGLGAGGVTLAPGSADARTRTAGAAAAPSDVSPDTGRDVTASLQAAIDKAAASKSPLHLAPGRYIVRSLTLRPGTRLIGSGPATILAQAGDTPVVTADKASGLTLESLSITGGFALPGPRSGLVELRDLDIRTSTASAIVLERCGGLVTGCRISGAAKAGIFSLDATGGLEISHNHLSAIANNGILVWRSVKGEDGTIVAMNRIEQIATRDGGTGENGNGINVFRAGSVLVTGNRVTDCAYTAVRANSASNVQIVANSIARMGEVAIFVEFAFEGAVVSSNLIDGASTGISVTNFDHGGRLASVHGNVVRNLFRRNVEIDPGGYGIAVEADAAVTGNTIETAPAAGLQIGWGRFCRDVAATGNVIRNSGVGIAITSDATPGTVLVASNMISGSRSGAIRLSDHGRLLGEDLAIRAPSAGRVRATGNATS